VSLLVACNEISRTYGTGRAAIVALQPTICHVEPGARIAVTGPSGSGKSTLLHLMAGLDDPSSGTVSWPGIGSRSDLRPGPVAMIFQGPSLLPSLNVIENVALPRQLAGVSNREALNEAREALALLDLSELRFKLPEEISGGQAQRVAAARVLASRPKLIFADEPTSQLDRDNGRRVLDVLLEAADVAGAALVVSTHDHTVSVRFPVQWKVADGRVAVP
jgi:ABC-type lipoprotein export system ATPase subunit